MMYCLGASAFSFVSSDRKMENLQGSPKKMTTYNLWERSYFHQDTIAKYKRLGKPLPKYERSLSSVKEYDTRGRLIKDDQGTWGTTVYTYDPSNTRNLLWSVQDSYNDDGSLRRHYAQTLDKDGFPVKGVAVDSQGDTIFVETYTTKHLPNGTIMVTCQHESYGDWPSSSNILTLRDDLSLISITTVGNGMIQTIQMDEKEQPVGMVERKNGNIVTNLELDYLPDARIQYNIDSEGNKTLSRREAMDKYGNVLEEIIYDPSGNITGKKSTVYEYDSHGNWIRRVVNDNFTDETRIIEREFVY